MPDPNPDDGDVMAGDRRISRPDTALPDWHNPDASYRPIPIAWFAGAFLLQMVTLTVIFVALASVHGFVTIAAAGLATGMIGAWTWRRGMHSAPRGWRIATIVALSIQLIFVVLGAAGRM